MPLGGVVVPPKIQTIKNFMYSSLMYLLKSSPELQFFSSANLLSFSRSSFVSLNLKTSALSFIFLLPFNISKSFLVLRTGFVRYALSDALRAIADKADSRTHSRFRHGSKAVSVRECVAMVNLGLNAPDPIYFFSLSRMILANCSAISSIFLESAIDATNISTNLLTSSMSVVLSAYLRIAISKANVFSYGTLFTSFLVYIITYCAYKVNTFFDFYLIFFAFCTFHFCIYYSYYVGY